MAVGAIVYLLLDSLPAHELANASGWLERAENELPVGVPADHPPTDSLSCLMSERLLTA
jgi:hypothetical protein